MSDVVSRRSYAWWVLLLLASISLSMMGPVTCEASFNIKEDGFSISNAPGYCFAMVAFARWYYLIRRNDPPLRKALNPSVQQRIARELQEFYSQHLIRLQADYCNKFHSNQNEPFHRLLIGLVSGEPRIVLLMNKGSRGAILHAVLAYDWIPNNNLLKIYDPNYISEERFIDLNKREYTSLDITYHSICFPEVLHSNEVLLEKMSGLYTVHVKGRATVSSRGPVASPQWKRAQAD
jgi:hypothetical protein